MARNKCEECGGKVARKEVEFKLYKESLGNFPAEVCLSCGEELFDEETSDRIDAAAKERGLLGLGAQTKLAQVGSSIAVTINKKIVNFMQLEKGEEVNVYPESKKRLVVEII